jgi:hypothetical protein
VNERCHARVVIDDQDAGVFKIRDGHSASIAAALVARPQTKNKLCFTLDEHADVAPQLVSFRAILTKAFSPANRAFADQMRFDPA